MDILNKIGSATDPCGNSDQELKESLILVLCQRADK